MAISIWHEYILQYNTVNQVFYCSHERNSASLRERKGERINALDLPSILDLRFNQPYTMRPTKYKSVSENDQRQNNHNNKRNEIVESVPMATALCATSHLKGSLMGLF